MKLQKLKLIILLSLWIVFSSLQAQDTMFVISNNGSNSQFLISSLRSLTFQTGSLHVNKLDGTNDFFQISSINKLFFSKVVKTGFINSEFGFNELSLYPNPVLSQLQIEYFSTSLRQGEISIVDLNGKIVFEQKITNVIGENKLIIDITTLTNGIYFCRINIGNKMDISKFIKSK